MTSVMGLRLRPTPPPGHPRAYPIRGGRVEEQAGAENRREAENSYLGLFAPYFERDCLRSLTPCVSSTPRST